MQSPTESMQLPLLLSASFGKFNKKIDRALGIHGISFTEYLVLHQLCNAPETVMSRIELAESVNLSASGVTRLLRPMEKIHLVRKARNNRDARYSLVTPTEAGMQLYQHAAVTVQQSADSLAQPLTGRQVTNLVELLEKIG
jgi:DNA-binding MarR family transcriptional regulator